MLLMLLDLSWQKEESDLIAIKALKRNHILKKISHI